MIFHYKIINEHNKVIDDLMAAINEKEVVDFLKNKGWTVLEVMSEEELAKQKKILSLGSIHLGYRVSLSEKISLTHHLATMIRSGLPIAEALDILSKDSDNPKLKQILEEAKYGLESGKPLSTCLSVYKDFDKGFINMIKAGEVSGQLFSTLEYIAQRLQQDYSLVSKVRAAMMYPAVIFVALISVGILMLTVVVPRIADVFVRLKVKIPWPTEVLLFLSKILVSKPLISIPIAIVLIILIIALVKSDTGKKILYLLAHNLPYVKKLAQQVDLSRFNHTFSLLLKSGVPIVQALEVSADTLSNAKTKKIVMTFKNKVNEGETLTESFRSAEGQFPIIMVRMISVGEKTGNLDRILEELANFYRGEAEQTLQTMANLIEPILMFVIGIVIGAMVLAIIGPMYQVVSQIANQ